jgi:hypothetical protein
VRLIAGVVVALFTSVLVVIFEFSAITEDLDYQV